jgi:hypothetical protein
MAEISVFNFLPTYCPSCGDKFLQKDKLAIQDFMAGASHTCLRCRAKYQYANSTTILSIAEDIKYYLEREI